MSYQLVDTADVTEPISLELQKAYSRIDATSSIEDPELAIMITTARVRLEQYLNIGLAKREVELQFDGRPVEMPLSPTGDIVSVKDGDTVLTTDDYTTTKYNAKTIWVNSVIGSNCEFFYEINRSFIEIWQCASFTPTTMYSCIYETGYDVLNNTLKQALLAECDFIYQLKGQPITALVSPNAAQLAAGYSRNLIL